MEMKHQIAIRLYETNFTLNKFKDFIAKFEIDKHYKPKKYNINKLYNSFEKTANDYIELRTERAIPILRQFIKSVHAKRTGNSITKSYVLEVELDNASILEYYNSLQLKLYF